VSIVFDSAEVLRALSGGVLIGLAAVLLLVGSGRIAGISGHFSALLQGQGGISLWFLAGLFASPWLVRLFTPLTLGEALTDARWLPLLGAGLLVGMGTQLGSGCTSGHGVCGLANLSLRSLVAVLVFMSVAILVVALGGGLSA